MRVIICGSRGFMDYGLLCEKMDYYVSECEEIEVISGRARGADSLGERWARERGLAVRVFPADWERYGRSAGIRRNAVMAGVADGVVAFWDGRSRGTADMIRRARACGLRVRVVRFGGAK